MNPQAFSAIQAQAAANVAEFASRSYFDNKPDEPQSTPAAPPIVPNNPNNLIVPQMQATLNPPSSLHLKKCLFHRQRANPQQQAQQHQQQLQLLRLNQQNGKGQVQRDAISGNIAPQLNAALLHERYLLLDLVEGSSFYRCIDIQTQQKLVCKVSLGILLLILGLRPFAIWTFFVEFMSYARGELH